MTFQSWIDDSGMVHRHLFANDRPNAQYAAGALRDILNQVDDPGAYICLEWNNSYCADFWTLVYNSDQSDYYSI